MKITVLAGGFSPERDVSFLSGSLIANSLCRSGHKVALLDVFFPYYGAKDESAFTTDGNFMYTIPKVPPDLDALRKKVPGNALIGDGVLDICRLSDVVFLALHGGMGEDGRIQAILSSMGIPYTGSDFSACLSAMDKSFSKLLFRAAGVATADFTVIKTGERPRAVAFPCVVKPCSCGSSVGVSIVNNEQELEAALGFAEKYEGKILIEDKIEGREFSVGILNGKTLPAIEICPKDGFYDYERKYQSGMTEEICPAHLNTEEAARLSEAALKAHRALGLGSYSRIDFIKDAKTGKFICLEANTLPGMTPASLLPQEAAAAGIDYDMLCETIALTALREMPA
ncbi:MAG: D-alanine--D-alanine ligase [Clostridia bacterium]|nr:D-alanine--D-alanine ligase [Clostridia bacterium]